MIEEIMAAESEKWNKTVRSFHDYDVFYLNEYVLAFRNENRKYGEPLLLLYENETDRAINVVFKRDVAKDEKLSGKIPKAIYYDLITPYGYGGFWGEIADYETLNATYNEYCLKKKYICEFVRFELFGNYYKYYDGEVEHRTHNVIRNLDMSLDEMWMDFKQKVRKNVKRANKNNLEIIIENTSDHLSEFLDIYYNTMERSEAEEEYYFSKAFYEMINQMKDNMMYFYAVSNEKIISAELVLYGSENCYSYLGGTYKEYFELRANDFLKYEIIKWAKKKGLKNYVLGGGYGSDDGIFKYKTCLAPEGIVDFHIGKKVFDQETYKKLVEIRAQENPGCMESEFFPQYRA